MYVSDLELTKYRNYQSCNIKFSRGINVLYGNNAQGKTNILEALYLFTAGKSHRTNKHKELIKFDSEFSKVNIRFVNGYGTNEGQIILHDFKKITVNGIPIDKISKLIGFFNSVLFSPEDLNLVKTGPAYRRKFLDIFISQINPQYFYNLQQYMRVLDQRNSLLKKMTTIDSTLEIWDEKLIEYGAFVILNRKIFIDKLKQIVSDVHKSITGNEQLDIKYITIADQDNTENLEQIKNIFSQKLIKNRKSELQNRTTMAGPHRDDIDILINQHGAKNYSSQGQQRTAVLSLKIAEMELIKNDIGEYPVLLLDDIMSELDENRQQYILKHIEDKQVIITCTDITNFSRPDMKIFNIKNGVVS